MNIFTYLKPESYKYNGFFATYFPDNINIDSTIKEGKIWMGNPEKFNELDPFDCNIPIYQHNPTEQNANIESVNEIFKKGMGVRCFTKDDKRSENEEFMWNEYADMGNGICLVFNPELDSKFFSPEDVIGVEYLNEFGPLNLNSKTEELSEDCTDFIRIKSYSFGIKKQKYAKENEIRIIKSLRNMDALIQDRLQGMDKASSLEKSKIFNTIKKEIEEYLKNNEYVRKCSFDKQSLVEVRFGYRLSEERISEIKQMLNDNNYTHVICIKSLINPTYFKL